MMSGRNWSRVQTTCHWTTAKEVSNTVCLILVIKSLWRPWEDFFQTKMQIKDFGTDSFISSIWWGIAIWGGPKRLSGFQQYDDLSDDDAGSQGQPGCLLTVQRQKALPYLCVKTIHLSPEQRQTWSHHNISNKYVLHISDHPSVSHVIPFAGSIWASLHTGFCRFVSSYSLFPW